MKKVVFACIMLGVLVFSSCLDKNLYQEDSGEQKEFNDFTFSTTQDVSLQVSYQNMGGIQASVYFEVYDQMPVETTEYNLVKIDGIDPLFADNTKRDGTFSKKISLPSYVKTLYLYSPAFYAQTLIEAEVKNGVVIFSDASEASVDTRTVAVAGGKHKSIAVTEFKWKEFLGAYDETTGMVSYVYNPDKSVPAEKRLDFTPEESSALYTAHSSIINATKDCPEEYRASNDMSLSEDAEIAVTMLGGNTCWTSSMGYYYYKEGEKPSSLKDAHVILIFPNTQDGKWNQWYIANNKYAIGVKRGTAVQLMYYPDIANGSKEGATTKFPKDIRIGFALITNAWTGGIVKGYDERRDEYCAATSNGLSIGVDGTPYNVPRTAVYRYNDNNTNAVLFSFEDHNNDNNFSDVVFTAKTNPAGSIIEIPIVTEKKTTTTVLRGVYAYEDLWPYKGDYDMNDAIVVHHYGKTYDASSLNKGIYEEVFYFKTLQNVANNMNGLGIKLSNYEADAEIILTVDDKEVNIFKKEDGVILLTDDIKTNIGKTYKLRLVYTGPKQKEETGVQPFIWKKGTGDSDKIWEVHIAKEVPTHLMDLSYFGKGDDVSNPDQGIYYVRNGNYPFAFFLAGATETDISKLLEKGNESTPIDKIYPGYLEWNISNGDKNADWYKSK